MPDLSLPHMCFSLDTPVEVARRTFAERYGVAPAYLDDRHECHAPGCRRNNCECDYPAHAKCCPNCNKKTGVRY